MVHSNSGWMCGCAGKTVKSLENTCHTWALLRWWFTTKRRYISNVCTFTFLSLPLHSESSPTQVWHMFSRDLTVFPAHPHVYLQSVSEWLSVWVGYIITSTSTHPISTYTTGHFGNKSQSSSHIMSACQVRLFQSNSTTVITEIRRKIWPPRTTPLSSLDKEKIHNDLIFNYTKVLLESL